MKHANCGCCYQNLDYPRFARSSTYSAKQLLARGSKLCDEVSEMDAQLTSQSNFYSESIEKPTSTEPSTGTTILTDSDEVPKVFVQPKSYEEHLPNSDSQKCTSFIQKIVDNAKTMLGTRCSALHPSSGSEEPTRETDNCQYDSNATTFNSSRQDESKSFPKYTPSDYCLCDADNQDSSSKLDVTTTAETLPKEVSREETLASSNKTFQIDRAALESVHSSNTNTPYFYSNATSKDVLENIAKLHKELKCDYSIRDSHIDNSVKYFKETSDELDSHSCHLNKDDSIYIQVSNPDKLVKDDGECGPACPKNSACSEEVNVNLEKADTGRRMFSLLDTTWLNPFRRDQSKKSDMTNKTKLETRSNIDNLNIPCRDVTCYRLDGELRANSAEPCKREQTIHCHSNEDCPISRHISRSDAENIVADTNRTKAKSCDPTCKVCARKKLEALNKILVSASCSANSPCIDTGTTISYHRCDPKCPFCSHPNNEDRRHSSKNEANVARHQAHGETERPPIVNASVGSAKVRTVVFDIIDKGTGVDSPTIEHSPSKENTPARFIEETPSNYKPLVILDDVCGQNSLKNVSSPDSQQESPCNSLSCQLSYTSIKQSKLSCKVSCPSITIDNIKYHKKSLDKKECVTRNDTYPPIKRVRSYHDKKDENNQCAFIGSPFLLASNVKGTSRPSVVSNPADGVYCPNDKDRINDPYKDGEFDRTKVKETDFFIYNNRLGSQVSQHQSRYIDRRNELYGRYDGYLGGSQFGGLSIIDDQLERVARELKTENKVLKSELLEMKLELKHALEKVEGPMRSKLEAEKSRCEQLQQELQKASFDMKLSHDTFIKESEDLKKQLSYACSNKNHLEAINRRLRDEMVVLDELCGKLEEDLVNQKLNEAETLKRLTRRHTGFNEIGVPNLSDGKLERDFVNNKFSDPENVKVLTRKNAGDIKSATDTLNESNLNIIARKLSRTIKETEPCTDCSILPMELTGAVKIIKDLTDMVEKRKAEKLSLYAFSSSRTNCSCQSPPCTEETACQCLAIKDVGVVVSKALLPYSHILPNEENNATETLYSVPKTFVIEDQSSKNIVQDVRQRSNSPSVYREDHICTDKPSMKNQYTDPKTADKKINYDPPRFAIIPSMVDKGINYETFESYNRIFRDPTDNVLTCYMVKTPVCPAKSEDTASKDKTTTNNTSNCKDIEHPPCEDQDIPCVKEVKSKYISCEQFEVSPCRNLEVPPCSDIGKPCFKDKKQDFQPESSTPQDNTQQKPMKFSTCDEEASPPCESYEKPCTKGEVCEPKASVSGSKSPCWKIGIPCSNKTMEKPDQPKELLVEDLGLSGDKEESEPLSNTYVESLQSSTEPKTTQQKLMKFPTCSEEDSPPCESYEKPCTRGEICEPKASVSGSKSPCWKIGIPCSSKTMGKPDQPKELLVEDLGLSGDKEESEPLSNTYVESLQSSTEPKTTQQKLMKFPTCSEEDSPPCEPYEKPCTRGEICEPKASVSGSKSPCWKIGIPCSSKTREKPDKPKELLVEDLGLSGDKEESEPLSSTYGESLPSSTEPKTRSTCIGLDNPPCADEGTPCVEKNESKVLKQKPSSPCAPFGEPCVKKKKSSFDPKSNNKYMKAGDKENFDCIPCSADGPCSIIGRPCAINEQTGKFNQMSGESGPGISLGKPFDAFAQTIETTDKMTGIDPALNVRMGSPDAEKLYTGEHKETRTDNLDDELKTDMHLITTTVKEGNLEVKTQGPSGVIETTLNYLPDGDLEVQTHINELDGRSGRIEGQVLNPATASSSRGTSDLETSSYIIYPSSRYPYTQTDKLLAVFQCPQTGDSCAGAFNTPTSLAKPILQSATTQGAYPRDTGITTDVPEVSQKGTRTIIETKSAAACDCIDQLEKTTSHTIKQKDATAIPFSVTTKETPVSFEDLSVTSPQQTSEVQLTSKSVGDDDTKATIASSTLPVETVCKAECTLDLRSEQEVTTENEATSDQETFTDTTSKEQSGTSPEEKQKKEAAVTVKPSKADKQESQIAASSQNADCGCQSTVFPADQSCQCCECKEIGVSTEYSENIPETMIQDKFSVKSIKDKIPDSLPATQPVGSIVRSDGSILRPDGIASQGDGRKDESILQPEEVLKISSFRAGSSTIKPGSFLGPDGTIQPIVQPDGSTLRPEGSIKEGIILSEHGEILESSSIKPDVSTVQPGSVLGPDETIQPVGPDGSITRPDGIIKRSDGSITTKDGTIFPKGSTFQPDGTVLSEHGEVLKSSSMKPDSSTVKPSSVSGFDETIQPVATVIRPDESNIRPDIIIKPSDAQSYSPDESTLRPDAIIKQSVGTKDEMVVPKGSAVQPSGTVLSKHEKILKTSSMKPDGSVVQPDETIVTKDEPVIPTGSVFLGATDINSFEKTQKGIDESHPVESIVKPDGVLLPDGTLISTDGTIHTKGSKIPADGPIVAPDSGVYPIGSIIQPDGSVLRPDGSVVSPDGKILRSGFEVISKTSSKKPEVQPDGTIIAADGTIQPIGSILSKDGNIIRPDGSVIRPDGSMVKPDGAIVRADGSIIKPDGSVVAPDGTVHPIGSIVREDGSVMRPDGSIVHKEGTVLRSDGTIVTADGKVQPSGSRIREDGSIQHPDGTMIRPEVSVERADRKEETPGASIHLKESISRLGDTIIHPEAVPSEGRYVKSSERLIRTIESIQPEGTARPDAPIEKYDSTEGSAKVKIEKGSKESKRGSSEVPDLVSKLSSKAMPSSAEILDATRPRKKRSSKLEISPCTCAGPCNCIICTSEIMEKRKQITSNLEPEISNTKLCSCRGNPNKKQREGEAVKPTQAYTFTSQTEPHPKNCECKTCRCDPCEDPCQYTSNAFSKKKNYDNLICPTREQCRINKIEGGSRIKKSRISIEDVFKPTYKKEPEATDIFSSGHRLDCECIDCLCTPVIRDLCSTRQLQVRDEKQIYQVSTIKCVCPNSLKGSKIPVSTNPAVPKVKSSLISCTCDPCQCSPCSDPNRGKGTSKEPDGSEEKDDVPTTDEILKMSPEDLKDLCECDPCVCEICFSKPNKAGAEDAVADSSPCCCKPGCQCELCQVEEMKKQIETLRNEIEALKPPKRIRAPGQPEDCNCEICICANEVLNDHPDDCDCEICQCPEGPNKGATPIVEGVATDRPDLPPDCDCEICDCPFSPLKTKARPGHPPDCDCEICACPLAPEAGDGCTCGDYCTCPGAPKTPKKEMQGCTCKPICLCPGGPIPMCECQPECFCSPCSDPRKRAQVRCACDCDPCECSPCPDPAKNAKPTDDLHLPDCTCPKCECAGDTEPQPQPDGCVCAVCKCEEEDTKVDTAIQCDCVECKCGEDESVADHGDDCICDICKCSPEDDFTHPDGCTCDICNCSPQDEPTHPEGCICDICECKPEEPAPTSECICPDPCKCDEEQQTSPPGLKECTCGDVCVCDQGDTADAKVQETGTHAKECKCPECICAEGGDFSDAGGKCACNPCACPECYYKSISSDTKECQCTDCTCIDCSDPNKEGDGRTCKCPDCKCEPCLTGVQPSLKCKCGVCTCIECEGVDVGTTTQPSTEKEKIVAGPIPKDRSCHCIECYCDDCNNEKKQGSKARPEIVIKISPVKKPATTETGKGETECTCLNCVCCECANKDASGRGEGATGTEIHGADCKCPTCTCISCAESEPKVKDAECHCSTCQCVDCTSKPTEDHGDNCKCPTCTCVTCQDIPPITKDAECHCSTCQCPECSTKTAETHPLDCKCPTCTCNVCDDIPPLKKDVECHCTTCVCPECNDKGVKDDNKGDSEPPPFEVPKKIDCDCKTCSCIICSSKAAGGDPKQASSTNAETFQIPERIPCACQECTCPLCNTEGHGQDQNGGKQVAAQFQQTS
ncbi:uncharacterized protein LOC130903723 isoform X2 [Diorhabda carinulata]|uniref:uncharacterized protein LOC130903723 isoform X2 n=1 Tax=Diorhabda carinulata TaxID=1163345 RepID=UPI0025A24DCC|nr:uncharacterized protein LOC130903723 isoform X2 [Diorhabda carinulata]